MSLWKAEQFHPGEKESRPAEESFSPEWLDRHPWMPILFLILLPFFVELPLVIFGLSTNPIWLNSGVVSGVHPGILPGLPYIDGNVGVTTQALGHLAAEDWLHGVIPWWNPYSGIGLPLAGEMQPNAFFLPFVFLLLLHDGVLWLKIAMQIFAGLATFFLLRELKLGRLAAFMGAALYAVNGTFAWLPGPIAVINTIPFLPLLLYGIERARREDDALSIVWIGLAIAGSLLAGFPEAAYINGLLALAWALYRFFLEQRRWQFAKQVVYGGILGLLTSAPLLVAFADYLPTTHALTSHAFGDVFLPVQALSNIFLPYIYGPIFYMQGNNIPSGIWGGIGGYAGVLVFLFAVMGAVSGKKERGLRWLLFCWIVIAWAKTFGFIPVVEVINHFPFMRDAAFFRYSPPSWEMALVILAAMSLNDIKQPGIRIKWAFYITIVFLCLAIYLSWPWGKAWLWTHSQTLRMVVLLCVAAVWAIGGLLLILFLWHCIKSERRRLALASVIIMDSAVLFMAPELSGVHPGKTHESAIAFLRSHIGLSRVYTLEPLVPNYGAYFGIASINYNYLPVASNWVDYISKHLFPPINNTAGVYFFGPGNGKDSGISLLPKFSHNYEKVGVRYVITNKGQSLMATLAIPVGTTNNTPLPLLPGEAAEVSFVVPKYANLPGGLKAIGVFEGNYGYTTNGVLAVKVCTAHNTCVTGSRPLSESPNNNIFSIPLEYHLSVNPNDLLTITFSHVGGSKPEALWLWPQSPSVVQKVTGPTGPLPGKALQLSLEYNNPDIPKLRMVYSGALMDIWELPHPASYYTVLHGNCSLSMETRDAVVAQCSTPSTLLRRELYMPGWSATVNGSSLAVSAHEEIFQTIPLGAGKNVVHFQFAPPYVDYAWIAFLFGLTGLIWQSYRAFFLSRFQNQKTRKEAL
ncbi:MAG: YfhO family protein [Acidithiobacillus sp.]